MTYEPSVNPASQPSAALAAVIVCHGRGLRPDVVAFTAIETARAALSRPPVVPSAGGRSTAGCTGGGVPTGPRTPYEDPSALAPVHQPYERHLIDPMRQDRPAWPLRTLRTPRHRGSERRDADDAFPG
ncbi:hypothetical protein SBRY_100225 [Actinacidiphila bryophytorum]|uniref:Uncharacterized protein n=1 Tax=Actinacidiphila bryophytorum TaxID=1436133 RepID=A0A9W4E3J3_9ACTN|nr:hypothetical protein SBRY_100225 [Actinacidiphila bryophytorum]